MERIYRKGFGVCLHANTAADAYTHSGLHSVRQNNFIHGLGRTWEI
jgi:hypothetical protein